MRGLEQLSRGYRFDVELSSTVVGLAFEQAVLGQRVELSLRVGGATRTVCGLVNRITALEHLSDAVHGTRYSVRIVPTSWLLGRRKTSRIFQYTTVRDVIDAIAQERQIETRWDLAAPLPPRDYITQYRETDLQLIRRLCAENGIFDWFSHPRDTLGQAIETSPWPPPEGGGASAAPPTSREVWMFSNAPHYPSIGALRFRSSSTLVAEEEAWVTAAKPTRRIRPNVSVYREYDPVRPLATLESTAMAEEDPAGLETYEHHSRDLYPNWAWGISEAGRQLAQDRRRVRTVTCTTSSLLLYAGASFVLDEGPDETARGAFAAVRVEHDLSTESGPTSQGAAEGSTTYHNTVECVPATVHYSPRRPEARCIEASLTALVVGPPGEEIHVNERGEIKVKFHWDRRLPSVDNTCWLRTLQPWAGPSWGFQFIPRVGMEVLVVFDGGDPDKPIVAGCLYNGIAPMPFATPVSKTKSGVVTRSSPRSNGFNELSFEDAADAEVIRLRAQRDLETITLRDRSGEVGRDDKIAVGGSRTVEVKERLTEHSGPRDVHVGADDTLHVRGKRTVRVDESLEESVASRSTLVTGRDHLEVRGSLERAVGADWVVRTGGNVTTLVGKDEARRSYALQVSGSTHIESRDVVEIASDKEVILRSGTSFVRVSPGGIEIGAGKVTVRGKDARLLLAEGEAKLKVKSKAQVVSDDAIVLKSAAASLGLSKEAKLDGIKVLLNSPEQASDTIECSEPDPLRIELVDDDGKPLPYRPFRIVLDGGAGEIMGFTDEDGKAKLLIEGSGRITFPDLSKVEEA